MSDPWWDFSSRLDISRLRNSLRTDRSLMGLLWSKGRRSGMGKRSFRTAYGERRVREECSSNKWVYERQRRNIVEWSVIAYIHPLLTHRSQSMQNFRAAPGCLLAFLAGWDSGSGPAWCSPVCPLCPGLPQWWAPLALHVVCCLCVLLAALIHSVEQHKHENNSRLQTKVNEIKFLKFQSHKIPCLQKGKM